MAPDGSDSVRAQPKILSYLLDIPNLCSLSGLACTVLALYFILRGHFDAAMIGMVWAVAFDWADGLIARRLKNRTGDDRQFGAQLDVLIDIVSYGVTPAVLLMCYGQFAPIFLIGAFLVLAASAIRLSYFSTFGLSTDAKYTGLAMDNNSLALVFIFLFTGFFNADQFSIVLVVTCLILAGLKRVGNQDAEIVRQSHQCLWAWGLYGEHHRFLSVAPLLTLLIECDRTIA